MWKQKFSSNPNCYIDFTSFNNLLELEDSKTGLSKGLQVSGMNLEDWEVSEDLQVCNIWEHQPLLFVKTVIQYLLTKGLQASGVILAAGEVSHKLQVSSIWE